MKVYYVPHHCHGLVPDPKTGEVAWVYGVNELTLTDHPESPIGKVHTEKIRELTPDQLSTYITAIKRAADPAPLVAALIPLRPKYAWDADVLNDHKDGHLDLNVYPSGRSGVILTYRRVPSAERRRAVAGNQHGHHWMEAEQA